MAITRIIPEAPELHGCPHPAFKSEALKPFVGAGLPRGLSPSSQPPLRPHPRAGPSAFQHTLWIQQEFPSTLRPAEHTRTSHGERQREQGRAVSIATLGFSFPAHQMPKQSWRGAAPSRWRRLPTLTPTISTSLGPIQTSKTEGRASWTLGPAKAIKLNSMVTDPPGAKEGLRESSVHLPACAAGVGERKRG